MFKQHEYDDLENQLKAAGVKVKPTYPVFQEQPRTEINRLQDELFSRLITNVHKQVMGDIQVMLDAGMTRDEIAEKYVLLTNFDTEGMTVTYSAQLALRKGLMIRGENVRGKP
jgi:hypothetical protein